MRHPFSTILCTALILPLMLLADPPTEIDYQGKVLVGDIPFTGTGYFKFALSDQTGTTNYWANDNATTGEPGTSLTNDLFNGVFKVNLGDADMSPIDRSIFSNGQDLYLRVWFSDDDTTFAEMLPSQRMLSHGFAVNADQVDGLDASQIASMAAASVTLSGDVTGPVTATQLSPGAIVNADVNNAAAIAPGKISGTALTQSTAFSGDVTGLATATQLSPGVIVNADVNNAAAIAPGKIAGTALTQGTAFAGDVTGPSSNLQIGANTISGTELANASIVNAHVAAAAAIQGSKIQMAGLSNAGVVNIANGSGAAAPFNVIDDSDTRLNSFGTVNGLTAPTPNSSITLVGTNGVTIATNAPNTLIIGAGALPVLSNTLYVAINGSPTGPGTIAQPYDMAQTAYDAAAANFPGVPSAIVLMGGGGYGPLTMHAGTVHVLGTSRSILDELIVAFGVPSPPTPTATFPGKQRVENVVVRGPAMVTPNGAGTWVKFHNCRFLDGLMIDESYVEVQHCKIARNDLTVPAAAVGLGGSVTEVGFYHTSILSVDTNAAPGTLAGTLTVSPTVRSFEVIGCQIANEGAASGGTAPAIQDLSPPIAPPGSLHLYSHNVIKGPPSGTGNPAVADSVLGVPPPVAATIVFTHNTVYGDVGGTGGVALPAGAPQYFANNTIYGVINFPGAGSPVGWVQAGAGPGLDAAGNAEHPVGWGAGGFTLPSHWDD